MNSWGFSIGYFLAHCFLVPTSIGLCSLVGNWWFALLQDKWCILASAWRHNMKFAQAQKTPFANKFFLMSQYGWENRQNSLSFLSLLCISSWCFHYVPYNGKREIFLYFKKVRKAGDVSPWPGLCSAAGEGEAAPASLALTTSGSWAGTVAEDGHHRLFPEDLHKSLHSVLWKQRILGLFRHISESSAKHRKSAMDYQKLILFLAFWAVKFERSPGAA